MATQNEIAKHLDLSVTAVKKMLESVGLPTKDADLSEARIEYIRKLRGVASGRVSSGDFDLTEERARLAHFQADKTELESEVLKGNLIPIDHVIEEWEKLAASFRARMLSLPTKASHLLLNKTDFSEVEKVLKTHIYEALTELAYETDNESQKAHSKDSTATH